MKFVHAADLHIDSPLRGLDRYEGAPVARLRGATRRALENLVAACIDEQAAFLLLAGDIFDGQWKDFSTGLFFAAQMSRLRDAKIPVVVVRGNHDAASAVTKALRLPDNVHELSSKAPQTFEIAAANTCIHGQSFAHRATLDDLAAKYPAPVSGAFNVGLLHTSLDGRQGHEPYAPTSLDVLRAKGYDYWALGHVHRREILSTDPYVVFPGNLQGRHARETGEKGASIVTVEGGVIRSVEHRALDVVRWETVEIDVSEATDAIEAVDRTIARLTEAVERAEGRVLAARVVVHGTTPASTELRRESERFVAEIRAAGRDTLGDDLWIEKVFVETRARIDVEALRRDAGAVGHLARKLQDLRGDPKALADLADECFADLARKLPAELREGEGALSLLDTDELASMIDDVEQTLLPRLLEGRDV